MIFKAMCLVVVLFSLAACSPAPKQPLTPAFFYWETRLDISSDERDFIDSLSCKKLYIKTLDIGRNAATGEIEPYSSTSITDTANLIGLEIIPSVFITNEVFSHISEEKTEWLAGKIAEHFIRSGIYFRETLFDCDWTPSTRGAFFLFLKKMRQKLPQGTIVSVTIRLHQYKFPKQTGVPLADRGMLMFYNTGDVDEERERNTVFHPEDALKYLKGAPQKYPIPLDLALPLFSWGLVFREGELWKIVPGPLPLEEMHQSNKYVEQPLAEPFAAQLWEVKEGTFLGGHYLRPGDHLRVSVISTELLFKAADLAQKIDLADDAALVFFHLGIVKSENFSAQLLDSVCNTVRK